MSNARTVIATVRLFMKIIAVSSMFLILAAFLLWYVAGADFAGFTKQVGLFILAFVLAIIGALVAMKSNIQIHM